MCTSKLYQRYFQKSLSLVLKILQMKLTLQVIFLIFPLVDLVNKPCFK